MDVVKKQRIVQRRLFTKNLNSFIAKCNDVTASSDDRQVALQMLESRMQELELVNTKYVDLLSETSAVERDIEAERKVHDAYKQKFLESKLRFLGQLDANTQQESHSNRIMIQSGQSLEPSCLEVVKYSGGVSTWLQFWSHFRTIHEDDTATSEEKLIYLKWMMEEGSEAENIVNGFPTTGDNYTKAFESLRNRFGRDDLLIEFYTRELLSLALQTATNKGKRVNISMIYDKISEHIRALETLGVRTDNCATMLYPLVESSLPEKIFRAWQRSMLSSATSDEAEVPDRLTRLLQFLRAEVGNEERIRMEINGFTTQASAEKKSKDNESRDEVTPLTEQPSTSSALSLGEEKQPHKTQGVILNKGHFETFVRDLLLVKQYRVEVYVNQGSSKNQNWVLEYKGSPGNLSHFEDVLFGNNDIAVGVSVIAVKLGTEGRSRIVGLSCVDVVSTLISVTEFQDNESFSNLESLIVTLAPKECLLIQGEGSYEFQTLKQLMERSNVLVTLRKKSEFSSDSIIDDLNTLIKFKKGQKQNAKSLPEVNLKIAMSSTSALIKYLDLTSDEGHMNQFTLNQVEHSRYVRLDSAAIKALNIEPRTDAVSNLQGNPVGSVLTLLDKCRTAQGHRLIAQWVRQPLRDLALIKERHDIVELLVNNNELRSVLSDDYLRRVPDLQQLAKKLTRVKSTLQDCYKIYLCVSYLPKLLEQLRPEANVTALQAMVVDPLRELIEDMDKFQQLVEQTIDLDAAEKGDFMVNPGFADDFKALKDAMDETEEAIQRLLGKAADDLCLEAGKTVKLESNQQFGYYFRITLKEEKILRNKKHYTILDSNKNGVRFRNSKLSELNDDFIAARDKYLEKQKGVIAEIMAIAAGYSESVRAIGGVLACLDVLAAFASAAVSANKVYVRPEMLPSEAGELNLTQVRHPCLEMQQGIDYIANDVSFKRDQCHFCIITGPNMGGKSTYIRSVGVTALMAHIGSFVPCDKATVSLLDCILARVGADDSQLKGLSTFMMEMIETAAIIKTATCNSLVIIDELGRGTSTYEGCGIAWSIAEHLARDIRSYCLFATHFHEITRLAEEIPTVKNQHVTALVEDNKLTLLYKVKPGICDQSFGIHVAKMANFPQDVIEFAKRKQAELEDYQGIVFEGSDNPKKKLKIIQEAETLILEFLTKCKDLGQSLSDAELEERVSSLKNDILSHKNPYIEALFVAS